MALDLKWKPGWAYDGRKSMYSPSLFLPQQQETSCNVSLSHCTLQGQPSTVDHMAEYMRAASTLCRKCRLCMLPRLLESVLNISQCTTSVLSG